MKRKIRNLCMGIILTVALLGSSLTSMAAVTSCKHNFSNISATYDRTVVLAYHTHTDRATGLTYKCTEYADIYIIKDKCNYCQGEITYEEKREIRHVPGDW